VDPKFLVNLNGKEYPTYPGVLAEAHEQGLRGISTALIQIPSADNDHTAIVRATVRMVGRDSEDETLFEDYGDASPRNCSARVATALIRMASTRAKGRALRDAVNIGQTLAEEIPDEPPAHAYPVTEAPRNPNLRVEQGGGGNGQGAEERREDQPLRCAVAACRKELKPAQVTFSKQHHPGPPLCKSCLDKVGRTA
jgi:hypothetical protein